jgi:hypothetical protein
VTIWRWVTGRDITGALSSEAKTVAMMAGLRTKVPAQAVLLVRYTTRPLAYSPEELAQMLALPPKQAAVVHALLSTGILPGFAAEDEEEDDSLAAQRLRRMSRFHLDALFRRFNVRYRTELVRRVALLLGAIW